MGLYLERKTKNTEKRTSGINCSETKGKQKQKHSRTSKVRNNKKEKRQPARIKTHKLQNTLPTYTHNYHSHHHHTAL
jgi:hypothetical protein